MAQERKQGFWLYTIVGLVFGIGGAAAGYFTNVGIRNPAHVAYSQHRADYDELVRIHDWRVNTRNWRREHHVDERLQRQFEEALVGIRSVEEIADQRTRRIAYALRPASFGTDPRRQMSNTISLLNGERPDLHTRVFDALRDEDRLTRLLNGDRSAVEPRTLATFEPIADIPAFTEREPAIRLEPRPSWFWILYGSAASLLFSIGFCLAGIAARERKDGNKWERPLAVRPESIVGFLIWIIGLPGFLFFSFVKFLFTDPRPWIRRILGKEFQSELDRQLAKLGALKERATKLANKEMLTQIESTEQRIRVAANSQELSGLANELDDVKNHLDGIVEADSVVGRSSKTPAGG